MEKQVVIVTGANRGLGFASCTLLAEKGYTVILTSRDKEKGVIATKKIQDLGHRNIFFQELDVTKEKSCEHAIQNILKEHKRIDILINNAGVFYDEGEGMKDMPYSIENIPLKLIKKTLEINLYGPIQLTQKILPIMKKQNFGRIVNVSSGMGQMTEGSDPRYNGGGFPSYRISKTALNVFTRNLSFEIKKQNILVNSVCPGWCRTDMGGKEATRSAEQGAEGIVWAATLPDKGPSGKFFRDKKEIPW